MSPDEVHAVAERVDARLATTVWDLAPAAQASSDVSAATEVAVFALKMAGKRRQARLGGRFSRLVVRFSLAACVALASVAAACAPPSAGPEATAQAISQLPDSATSPSITSQPRASPARFTDLLLLDPGSATQAWALLVPRGGDTPVLVDRVGAGLDTVGGVYALAAQPVRVETRDGPTQFLDPLQPAVSTSTDTPAATTLNDQVVQQWGQDERYLAATRAIAGQPIVLDAAYNAAAASAAGGTHTYLNGVVLRVEPDSPVIEVIDKALLESGRPTRAEDLVYVAIRPSESALYEPGQVVNLRDVVVDKQTTDVNGQPATVYVANAALDGARVELTDRVDLQALLRPRMDLINQDLALQDQTANAAATPAVGSTPRPTATAGAAPAPVQQPIIVQQSNNNNGSAFVGDFLIFMWLTNGGFYRGGGGTTIINNYPVYGGVRPGSVYYSPPPGPGASAPTTVSSAQAASRSSALEAARTSVSGQSSGTGGGVAATNKSAADASSRVSAATSKSAAAAGAVSAASAGKSISSAPSSASSSTASRSAGSVSAGSRGSSGGTGSTGSSSSFGSGGKGISGSSGGSGSAGSSGSSGGFGGKGGGSSSSS